MGPEGKEGSAEVTLRSVLQSGIRKSGQETGSGWCCLWVDDSASLRRWESVAWFTRCQAQWRPRIWMKGVRERDFQGRESDSEERRHPQWEKIFNPVTFQFCFPIGPQKS